MIAVVPVFKTVIVPAAVLLIPTVIVVHPASLTRPIAGNILLTVMLGRHPVCTFVRRTAPISVVPPVAASDGIIVALHP
jgi:hypothetical protein